MLFPIVLLSLALAPQTAPDADPPIDWRETEKGVIAHQTQLTFPDRFVKAGESYFSPDGSKVIFQAVEVVPDGSTPQDFYAMFVADVMRNGAGHVVSLANHTRLSPLGSANTCGWFHPVDSNVVLFASTVIAPTESSPPGFQRGTGRYRWMFPPEMRIVQCDLRTCDGTAKTLTPLVEHSGAYMAECSLTRDGRHIVYCSLQSNQGDLFVKDLKRGRTIALVEKPGYDGGPFFSPDGLRLCWRSDRKGDNLLQVFVADLKFDGDGGITGIGPEHQLTNDEHVNWCPWWTRDGRSILFATSRMGHRNYEVFAVDADPGTLAGSPGPVRYGTNLRRVTNASGADVLPAFTADGKTMIWTSQRGEGRSSQLWAAEWVGDQSGAAPAGQ